MVAIGTNTQALKKHLLKNKWDLENEQKKYQSKPA